MSKKTFITTAEKAALQAWMLIRKKNLHNIAFVNVGEADCPVEFLEALSLTAQDECNILYLTRSSFKSENKSITTVQFYFDTLLDTLAEAISSSKYDFIIIDGGSITKNPELWSLFGCADAVIAIVIKEKTYSTDLSMLASELTGTEQSLLGILWVEEKKH